MRFDLHDGPSRQMATDGRQEVDADGAGPGRFAEKGQRIGIAAEGSDVVLDPLDGQRLVVEAHVARGVLVVQVEESESAHAIIEGSHDDFVGGGQDQGVVDLEGRRPAHVPSAVDPNEDRP